jgi:hypothetical protein
MEWKREIGPLLAELVAHQRKSSNMRRSAPCPTGARQISTSHARARNRMIERNFNGPSPNWGQQQPAQPSLYPGGGGGGLVYGRSKRAKAPVPARTRARVGAARPFAAVTRALQAARARHGAARHPGRHAVAPCAVRVARDAAASDSPRATHPLPGVRRGPGCGAGLQAGLGRG